MPYQTINASLGLPPPRTGEYQRFKYGAIHSNEIGEVNKSKRYCKDNVKLAIVLITLYSFINTHGQQIKLFLPGHQPTMLYDTLFDGAIEHDHVAFTDHQRFIKTGRYQSADIFIDELIHVSGKKFQLIVNPVLSQFLQFTSKDEDVLSHTEAGLHAVVTGSDKWSLQTLYAINLYKYPSFISKKMDTLKYIPHYGPYISNKPEINQFLWQNFRINLLYAPFKYLHLQAGFGKNAYGNGYRSLFLSDNANSYPYVRADVDVWNIQYSFTAAFLNDIHHYKTPVAFKNKYGVFHYFNWDINNIISLNLFESVIWAPDDSTTKRGFDINYANPVIFFRPIEFSTGSPDNVLMGFGLKVRALKNSSVYGQFLLDEFNLELVRKQNGWWGVKYGYQVGIQSRNLFQIPGLHTILELNMVRPFTYSHSFSAKSFGNYLQPLAHPLGSNFRELVSHIYYKNKRWKFQNRFFFQQYGKTDSLNYGNDIYLSSNERARDFGNELLQPHAVTMFMNDISVGYSINPSWNLDAIIGYFIRSEVRPVQSTFSYFYVGLRTNLSNHDYWDGRYQ